MELDTLYIYRGFKCILSLDMYANLSCVGAVQVLCRGKKGFTQHIHSSSNNLPMVYITMLYIKCTSCFRRTCMSQWLEVLW